MVLNRSRRARELAGLSVGQAASLLGISVDEVRRHEGNDAAFADADPSRLADLYGVNVEWLSGRCERCDYEPLKTLANADQLSFHDRDMLAELYASWPRRR